MRKDLLLIALCVAVGPVFDVSACMTIVAGKKVSSTGHVIVGHNEDFPFSVKSAKGMFSVADMTAILSAHNGPLKYGKHARESWSICAVTTIESSVCEFTATPRETIYHLALGHGCEKSYLRLRPFAEPLPAEIDESATAESRLARHVHPVAAAK